MTTVVMALGSGGRDGRIYRVFSELFARGARTVGPSDLFAAAVRCNDQKLLRILEQALHSYCSVEDLVVGAEQFVSSAGAVSGDPTISTDLHAALDRFSAAAADSSGGLEQLLACVMAGFALADRQQWPMLDLDKAHSLLDAAARSGRVTRR